MGVSQWEVLTNHFYNFLGPYYKKQIRWEVHITVVQEAIVLYIIL